MQNIYKKKIDLYFKLNNKVDKYNNFNNKMKNMKRN